jgi:hypothetical protein
MRTHSILCLAALCLLGACNQPAVSLKDTSFQPSENTVRDWNDVAHEISSALKDHNLLVNGQSVTGQQDASTKPIFVRVQAPESAFLQDVSTELEAEILRSGGTIARALAGATVVNLDVDFVKWSQRDKPPQAFFGLDPFGLVLAMTPTSNSEAIWQASVVTDTQVVMRVEKPVYVRDHDIPLYTKSATLMPLASWTEGDSVVAARPLRLAP